MDNAKKISPAANRTDQENIEFVDTYSTGEVRTNQSLAGIHVQELASSAISEEFAHRHGVYTAYGKNDLPQALHYVADKGAAGEVFPALVYPQNEIDGSQTFQVKPLTVLKNAEGEGAKYWAPMSHEGYAQPPKLPLVLKGDGDTVLIVEGTKQALAAAEYAPVGHSVLRICGILGWMSEGVPTPYLKYVRGKRVVIIADADAETNPNVYEGARKLGEACSAKGALSVSFARIPGSAKVGLDDYLASATERDDRIFELQQLIAGAKTKPADRKPAKERKSQPVINQPEESGDNLIHRHIGDDINSVTAEIVDYLRDELGGVVLFNRGGVLVQVTQKDDTGVYAAENAQAPTLRRLIRQRFILRKGVSVKCESNPPCDHPTINATDEMIAEIRQDSVKQYPVLKGISTIPVLRKDGSVCYKDGYDERSQYFVNLGDDIKGLADMVPAYPTADQVRDARDTLYNTLLGDFVLRDPTVGKTHMLAMLFTVFVRPIIKISPMFMLNGTQPRVGKTTWADACQRLYTGRDLAAPNAPKSEEERGKKIMSQFRAGDTFFFWDEFKRVSESPSMQALITAPRYSGRVLGSSTQLEFDNNITFVGAGNTVEIDADMSRRVVTIDIAQGDKNRKIAYPLPYSLEQPGERLRMLKAIYTLINAWFAAGRPSPDIQPDMDTFYEWQKVVGGILQVAGIHGFLHGIQAQQVSRDDKMQSNIDHLRWVSEVMGGFGPERSFYARDISKYLDPSGTEVADTPSEMAYPYGYTARVAGAKGARSEVTHSRILGKVYAELSAGTDLWFGPYALRQVDQSATNKSSKRYYLAYDETREIVESEPLPAGLGDVAVAPAPEEPQPIDPSETESDFSEDFVPMPVISDANGVV